MMCAIYDIKDIAKHVPVTTERENMFIVHPRSSSQYTSVRLNETRYPGISLSCFFLFPFLFLSSLLSGLCGRGDAEEVMGDLADLYMVFLERPHELALDGQDNMLRSIAFSEKWEMQLLGRFSLLAR